MKKILFLFALMTGFGFKDHNPTPLTAWIYGDSITAGTGASDNAHRWSSLVCAAKGWTEENHGVSGSTITPGIGSLPSFDPSVVPTYDASVYSVLVLAFGTNDCNNYGTAAAYKTALKNAIDAIKAKGWPASSIVVLSLWYFTSTDMYIAPAQATFVTAASQAATEEVTQFIDVYTPELNDENNYTYFSDQLHPNNAGHAFDAATVLAGLSGGGGGGITLPTGPVRFTRVKVTLLNVFPLAIIALSFLFSCRKETAQPKTRKLVVEWAAESDAVTDYTVEGKSDSDSSFYPLAISLKDKDTVIIQTTATQFRVKGVQKGMVYYSPIQMKPL